LFCATAILLPQQRKEVNMTKKILVLVLTAFAVAGANPALAHCGGSHGKSYRAATTSKKPVVAKAAQPKGEAAASAPIAETTAEIGTGFFTG
jgi:hypothetical protein